MKTINKFMLGIALVGALPMMTACSDDNGNEVVEPTPVEDPTFEILSELPDPPTFSFTAAGNKAQTLAFNTNQNWKIELVNTQEDDNYEWLTLLIARELAVRIRSVYGLLLVRILNMMRAELSLP